MRLDRFSQIVFEYCKDSAADMIRANLDEYSKLPEAKRNERMRKDVMDHIQDKLTSDMRAIGREGDGLVRNLYSEATTNVNMGAIADKICFEYAPKVVDAQLNRTFNPILTLPRPPKKPKLKVKFRAKT